MLSALNFETAVYWGQLSKCIESTVNISQYSCKFLFVVIIIIYDYDYYHMNPFTISIGTNTAAYTAACVFAVFILIEQVVCYIPI